MIFLALRFWGNPFLRSTHMCKDIVIVGDELSYDSLIAQPSNHHGACSPQTGLFAFIPSNSYRINLVSWLHNHPWPWLYLYILRIPAFILLRSRWTKGGVLLWRKVTWAAAASLLPRWRLYCLHIFLQSYTEIYEIYILYLSCTWPKQNISYM